LTAKTILTLHRRKPIQDGFILIGGNRILQVGERRDLKFLPSVRLLDLGDTVLFPGLINAHCHLDFTAFKAKAAFSGGFREWLTGMARRTRRTSAPDFKRSIRDGIDESVRFGTTTLCDTATTGWSYGLLREASLRAVVLFELLDFGRPLAAPVFRNTLEKIKRATALPPHPSTLSWGLAPHTPFTVSPELFHLTGAYLSRHRWIPTSVHVAESREERDFFATHRGPLAERTALFNPHWPRPKGPTPLQHLSRLGWLPKLDLAVHCNTVNGKDLDLLERHRVAVVHCPGSHSFFRHPRFRYKEFKKRGIPVCLGTDSLASNRSLSLLGEMRLFLEGNPGADPEEVMAMGTARPARALGWGQELGQVRPGFLADLIGVPSPRKPISDTRDLAAHVISHCGEVPFRMVNGCLSLRIAQGRPEAS